MSDQEIHKPLHAEDFPEDEKKDHDHAPPVPASAVEDDTLYDGTAEEDP